VVQKLGVGSTLAQAFLLPIFQFRDFLRIAAVPVLVFSVISGISYFLFSGTTFSLGMNPVIIPFFVIFFLLSGLMMIAFIVSWHRLVLLGPTETHRPFPPFFAKRDFRFLGYVFLLGIIALVIILVFSLLYFTLGPAMTRPVDMAATLWLSIGINAFVALLCYPFCHWLLVFPGLTIDESKPLKLVGTIIDGHRPRFFAIMLIVSSAVYGAEWAVSWAFLLPQFMGSDPLPADSMARMMAKSGYPQLVSFLQWTVGLFGSAVIASALSISFRKLKEAADAGPTPPAA
jgi:hypothetical protein